MAEVSLYVRAKINGKQQYIKPVWQDRKNLKPLWGFVAGQATHCPNGVYHLRYVKLGKRVWEHVGTSALTAASARETPGRGKTLATSAEDMERFTETCAVLFWEARRHPAGLAGGCLALPEKKLPQMVS